MSFKKIVLFIVGLTCFAALGTAIFKISEGYKPDVQLRKEFTFGKGLKGDNLKLTNSEKAKINNCLRRNTNTISKAKIMVFPDDVAEHVELSSKTRIFYKLQLTDSHGLNFEMKDVFCQRNDFVSELVKSIRKGAVVLARYKSMPGLDKKELRIVDI